jgi:hypothetical protein
LRVEVERERDDIHVAGALAVAEQRSLDAVGARHDGELGRGDGRPAVIVRVDAEHDGRTVAQVAVDPLDLVGVHVRRRHLHGRRQVDHDRIGGRRPPDVHDGLADLLGELELGRGKRLGRVFQPNTRALRHLTCAALNVPHGADGDVDDAVTVEAEHDAPEQRRGRVIDVHDRTRRTLDRLERAVDQIFACLREHLDRDVVRDAALLHQLANEIKIGLRCGREADLDLLEPHAHEQLEHAVLAIGPHRFDQGLIAVAQVDAAPLRRALDRAAGPAPRNQRNLRKGTVAVGSHRISSTGGASTVMPRSRTR